MWVEGRVWKIMVLRGVRMRSASDVLVEGRVAGCMAVWCLDDGCFRVSVHADKGVRRETG